MLPEVHTTSDAQREREARPPSEPSEPTETPATDSIPASQEAPPTAAPPTPPQGRIVASIQRMPPAGRWTLGLGMAFLAGFGFLFSPLIGIPLPDVANILPVLAIVLALAAGFVLSSWRGWAVLALADAAAIGGFVASWALTLGDPSRVVGGGDFGQALYGFSWFMLLGMVPLVILLLVGVSLGRVRGMAAVPPRALSTGAGRVGRWVAVLVPAVLAGLLAWGMATIEGPVSRNTGGLAGAIVLAASCLLAGWLLRSWWGLVAAPVVYVGVALGTAALMVSLSGGKGAINAFAVLVYLVLPAVVMSAIGTAIGMYRARQRELPPRITQPAS